MAIDIKSIGTFGLSFSKGLDQTWVNIIWKEDGYSVEFYQDVEDDESDDDEMIDTSFLISHEQGEAIFKEAFEKGRLEEWKKQYSANEEGIDTDLTWTVDVDDKEDADLLFVSGNRKLPPDNMMNEVIAAVRAGEERFAKCFKEFR